MAITKDKKITGLKKREQIAKANKTVFIWVAAAGVALSLGIAIGQVLISQALFNQKIISEKSKTSATLTQNIEASKELKQNVDRLLVNQDLLRARAGQDDSAWKVVLDALPTANEPLAFGSSLQLALLPKTGATIENLSIGEGEGGSMEVAGPVTDPAAEGSAAGGGQIPFSFTATGNISQIRNVFTVLEQSIRPIAITAATVEGSDNNLKVTIQGYTSYQDAKSVTLQKKSVTP